jgi:hypothetical protein
LKTLPPELRHEQMPLGFIFNKRTHVEPLHRPSTTPHKKSRLADVCAAAMRKVKGAA